MTRHELTIMLPLILRERDYIEVTTHVAAMLRTIDSYHELIHLENETGTVNWKSEVLPDCHPGYVRLWTRQDWQLTDNVRAKVKLAMQAERSRVAAVIAEMDAMRARIVKHFTTDSATPLPKSIIETIILKDADHSKLTAIMSGLNITLNN